MQDGEGKQDEVDQRESRQNMEGEYLYCQDFKANVGSLLSLHKLIHYDPVSLHSYKCSFKP